MIDDQSFLVADTPLVSRRIESRLRAEGCEVRSASEDILMWENPSEWSQALMGVGSVFLSLSLDQDVSAIQAAENMASFTLHAAECGVTRFVLESRRADPTALACELQLQAYAPEWTVLRTTFMAQNFTEGLLRRPVAAGHFRLPSGPAGIPVLDAEDLADVAVATLTGTGHNRKTYELTGPESISFCEIAAELSRVGSRTITFEGVGVDAVVQLLVHRHFTLDHANTFARRLQSHLDGRTSHPTLDVQTILGRPPRGFFDFALRAARQDQWDC